MARLFDDGSDEYLATTSPGVTGYPLTIAAWFNFDATHVGTILSFSDSSGSEQIRLILLTDKMQARADNLGGSADDSVAEVNVTLSTDTWYHACGAYTATDDFNAYLDGANKTADDNGATNAPASIDTLSVGRLIIASPIQAFSGLIAECGVWNVVLTDVEVAVLAAGASPLFVRPESLVHYYPLIGRRDPEIDHISGADMALFNTPSTGAHPRIFYPRRHAQVVAAAAAPGGIISPYYYLRRRSQMAA